MKKKIAICAIAMMTVCALAGCGDKTDKKTESTTQLTVKTEVTTLTEVTESTEKPEVLTIDDTTTEIAQETGGGASDVSAELDEATMRALMKENINCNLNIFALGNLMPVGGEYDTSMGDLVEVDPSEFADWDSFEEYVRSVYCQEAADMYLYNYPYEGQPKYVNQDGKLYLNMTLCGGKGYYVDWTDYQIEVTASTDTRVEVKMIATVEWPSDEPVREPYEATGAFVYENGKWLLESMIY